MKLQTAGLALLPLAALGLGLGVAAHRRTQTALPGPLAVEELEASLTDASRSRELPLRIWLPAGPGPFPLILFSHGVGGEPSTYAALLRSWASHGYAVIAPSHPGSDARIFVALGRPARRLEEALQSPKNWADRPQDISFILDSLPALEARLPALAGKLDLSRIGMSGHSFGASTSAAIAGVPIQLPGEAAPRSFRDGRPKAFVLLSPTRYGDRGFRAPGWQAMTRPLLAMTGTRDVPIGSAHPEERTLPFRDAPPGDKWLIVIEGAEHMSFAGGLPFHRVPAPMQRAIEEATLSFWDAELKGDTRARALLQPAALESEGLRVHVEAK